MKLDLFLQIEIGVFISLSCPVVLQKITFLEKVKRLIGGEYLE